MKILIVEDDHFFQHFYTTKLKEFGYELAIAQDGIEALAKIKEFQPDLILLDIIMPNKDGFQVLDEVGKEYLSKVPVLVFSTLGQESDVQKALSMGARDFVNKSFFDFDLFLKKVFSYLPQKQ